MLNPLADLFFAGADRATSSMELARLFAHRRGFAYGLVVGSCIGSLVANVILALMGAV